MGMRGLLPLLLPLLLILRWSLSMLLLMLLMLDLERFRTVRDLPDFGRDGSA